MSRAAAFMQLFIISVLSITSLLLLIPATAGAQTTNSVEGPTQVVKRSDDDCHHRAGFLGFPTWYEYLQVEFDSKTGRCEVHLPVDGDGVSIPAAVVRIAAAVFDILLRVAGIVAVAFVIVGGVNYIFSDGQPEKAGKAFWTIVNALIGLVIVIVATAIVAFIGDKFIPGQTEGINIPTGEITAPTLHSALQLFFGLLAAAAFLVIVIAGIRLTLHGSNPQEVSKLRNVIFYAVIGLVIAMSAFSIVTFVVRTI